MFFLDIIMNLRNLQESKLKTNYAKNLELTVCSAIRHLFENDVSNIQITRSTTYLYLHVQHIYSGRSFPRCCTMRMPGSVQQLLWSWACTSHVLTEAVNRKQEPLKPLKQWHYVDIWISFRTCGCWKRICYQLSLENNRS